MINDWVCSLGNYLGGSSVDELSLPLEKVKWSLDFTSERFEGVDMCIAYSHLYFPSYVDGVEKIRCVDLVTGNVVWEKIHDFGQITQLCVIGDYLNFGFLVLDRRSGDKVYDLRELCEVSGDSELGYARMVSKKLIKTVSGFDLKKGFVVFDLESRSCGKLEYDNIPVCAGGDSLIGRKEALVSNYNVNEGKEVWSFQLNESCERFCRVVSDESVLVIKNMNVIYFVDFLSGELLGLQTDQKLAEQLGQEIRFGANVKLLCKDGLLVIVNDNDKGGWLVTISLKDFTVKGFQKFNIYGGTCLAGDYLFTIDKDHNPIALSLPDLEPCWKGERPITASKVIAGSNHVVYAFPGGGFQCYGPANE